MFEPKNSLCPIKEYKISKVTRNDYPVPGYFYDRVILVERETGVLKIINFDNVVPLSKIYVGSTPGTDEKVWSQDTNHVATLEIVPDPKPKNSLDFNFLPYFEDEPKNATYSITEFNQTFEYNFGKLVDPEGTKVSLSITSKLVDFMKYNDEDKKIEMTGLKKEDEGDYPIDVVIYDENQQMRTAEILISIKWDIEEEEKENAITLPVQTVNQSDKKSNSTLIHADLDQEVINDIQAQQIQLDNAFYQMIILR